MSLLSLVIAGLVAAAMLILLLLVLRRCFVVVAVTGRSMAPALMPGDRLLVRRGATHGLRAGLIVVFSQPLDECQVWDSDVPPPIQWTIKRVVALPGDAVPALARPAIGDLAVVPPGMLVVFGDNVGSIDSRTWGFLPVADVLGVAVRRLSPSGSRPEI
jgi:signal peptidase I